MAYFTRFLKTLPTYSPRPVLIYDILTDTIVSRFPSMRALREFRQDVGQVLASVPERFYVFDSHTLELIGPFETIPSQDEAEQVYRNEWNRRYRFDHKKQGWVERNRPSASYMRQAYGS